MRITTACHVVWQLSTGPPAKQKGRVLGEADLSISTPQEVPSCRGARFGALPGDLCAPQFTPAARPAQARLKTATHGAQR
jgi:hypothetical protein